MRSLIRDQAEATRVGLEWAQISANKAALENLCKVKDEEYNKALAEFDEGKFEFHEAASNICALPFCSNIFYST